MTKQIQTPGTGLPKLPSKKKHPAGKCIMSRRNFLLSSGVTTATIMVTVNTGAAQVPATLATYPRKKITSFSALKNDQPIEFSYPDEGAFAESLLVKLGTEAGGGIGPDKDVVAYNHFCTHQGGDLTGSYKSDTKSLGACPLHLSTYDLTRHGILISGQAYQSLPQVLLEMDGDDIYAVGVFGLIFGRYDNLQG
jgi:arsenite oxidase small subunit